MSGYFSEELLDEIKNSNDIVDVVSEYVKLKKSGKNYFGLCPFHTEKSPSFSVASDKQIFFCFGCGAGGNVLHFISKIENLEFTEAVKFLAERAKIHIDETNDSKFRPEAARLKEEILEINKEAARYFFTKLSEKENETARNYIKNRGLSSETIKKFGLGFSSYRDNELSEYLISKGYKSESVLASGLSYPDSKNKLHDRFRGRVIFPIFDVRDRVIGFGGRVLDNSQPKYLNSPETMIFNKRRNLYGLNYAKKSQDKKVIVVEGYMDAISMHQNGIDNVVATLGTAMTTEQGRLLRKYFEEIVIAYDSDSAGQAAAIRGLDLLSDMEISVRVMKIEEGKDPDEFVRKKGAKYVKAAIDSAKSLAEYKIDLLKQQYDLNDTKGKIEFLNKMAGVLAKVKNNIERDAYIKNISKETGISQEPICAEIDRILYGHSKKIRIPKAQGLVQTQSGRREEVLTKIKQAENMLIALLSNNDKRVYEYIKDRVKPENFYSDLLKNIAEKIYAMYEQGKDVMHSDILSVLETEEEISTYSGIVQKDYEFEDSYRIVVDLFNVIQREKLEERKKNILAHMKNENLTNEEVIGLERKLIEITTELKNIKYGTDKHMKKGGV
ncbi:MAG: DNA primase [Deltaproteobacteria bacterium]